MRSPATDNGDASRVPSGGSKQTILLVDDEVDILDSLKGYIEASLPQVQVRTVLSGQEGLKVLAAEPVDLILTDFKMPGMNGLHFLERAQEVAPGVPRVLITAFPDVDIVVRAINEANIENFFTKPFEPDAVVAAIRGILLDQRTKTLVNRSLRSLSTARLGPAGDQPA